MPNPREPESDARPVTLARWRRLFCFVRPSAGRLAIVLFAIFVSSLAGLLGPVLIEQLLNRAVAARLDFDALVTITTLMIASQVVALLVGVLQEYQMGRITTAVLFRMRRAFFDHLHVLPVRLFAKTRMGDILTRLTRDLSDAQGALLTTLLALFSSTFTIMGSLLVMAHYNGRLLLLLAALCLPVFVAARLFRRAVRERTGEVRRANEKIASYLVESFSGMKEARAFGRERRASLGFVRLQHDLAERVMRSIWTSAFAGSVPNAVVTIASIGVFYYGGVLVVRGEEKIGDLVAFAALQARVYGPLRGLIGLYHQLQRAGVGVDRVFEYLDMPADTGDSPDAAPLVRPAGDVVFEGVRFDYEPGRTAIEDVSFTIPAGKMTAIVGKNGSGKSTLVELLLRLHRPDAGRITIGGEDIKDVTQASLLDAVAVCPQDPALFHATIRENIAFGKKGARKEEIERVAEIVGLAGTPASRPEGLDTVIGERGRMLSSGERQRIALARALLRDPKILVLDEATAHLDPESDRAFFALLAGPLARTTRVLITHRLHHVGRSDEVVVLDRGRVLDRGPVAEVAARSPFFKTAVRDAGAPGSDE